MSLETGPLKLSDAAAAADLERECFSDPWSLETVEQTIRRAEEGAGALSYGAFGVWEEERLIGVLFSMAVAGEGELHRIAVDAAHRGRGAALALMEVFFRWLKDCGCNTAFLEVREGNLPAIRLYEKCGFVLYGRRKGYYHAPEEDALLFRYQ